MVAFEVEVKRGGTPEVAPPLGEDLGAGAVVGREEGDDLPEDGVGEGADVVDASSSIAFIRSGRRTASGASPRRPRFRAVRSGQRPRFWAVRSGRRRFPLLRSSTGRLHLLGRPAKEPATNLHGKIKGTSEPRAGLSWERMGMIFSRLVS